MTQTDIPLPQLSSLRVASPCPARWEDMVGDDKIRHCALCDLDVHNFPAMTESEINAILEKHIKSGQRLCGRLYQRVDGTVLINDCPVGLAKVRARIRWAWIKVAAFLGLLTGTVAASKELADHQNSVSVSPRIWRNICSFRLRSTQPFTQISENILPGKPTPSKSFSTVLMGDIAIPPPLTKPPQQSTPSPSEN